MFTEGQFLRNQRKYNGFSSLTMLGAEPTPRGHSPPTLACCSFMAELTTVQWMPSVDGTTSVRLL